MGKTDIATIWCHQPSWQPLRRMHQSCAAPRHSAALVSACAPAGVLFDRPAPKTIQGLAMVQPLQRRLFTPSRQGVVHHAWLHQCKPTHLELWSRSPHLSRRGVEAAAKQCIVQASSSESALQERRHWKFLPELCSAFESLNAIRERRKPSQIEQWHPWTKGTNGLGYHLTKRAVEQKDPWKGTF